jgi:23S rRNA pseudouridine2605 synthase
MTEKSEEFGKKPVRRSKSEESEPAKVYRPRTLKLSSGPKNEDAEGSTAPKPTASEAIAPENDAKNWEPSERPRKFSKPREERSNDYPSDRPRSSKKFSDKKEFSPKESWDSDDAPKKPESEDFNYAESKKKSYEPKDLDPEVTRKPSFRDEKSRDREPSKGRYGDKDRSGSREYSRDSSKRSSDKPGRFDRSDRPTFRKDDEKSSFGKPSRYSKPDRDSDRKSDSEKSKGYSSDRPYKPREDSRSSDFKGKRSEYSDSKPRRDFDKPRSDSDKPRRDFDKPRRESDGPRRDFDKPRRESDRPRRDFDKPRSDFDKPSDRKFEKPFNERGSTYKRKSPSPEGESAEREGKHRDVGFRKAKGTLHSAPKVDADLKTDKDGLIRLNKYVANSGLCSRREADEYIAKGLITVNGEVVNVLGTKVSPTDEIRFKDNKLDPERKVYILLNKPKDYVTTVEDPNAKYTVMDLIEGACDQRVYPVGRLDRNSTGLLLLTNDGELTTKLTHPSFEKKKIYEVGLDRNLSPVDMDSLIKGVVLDDGVTVHADTVAYINEDDKSDIGIEIHSGQNRVVRRMFESLGYKVSKLDRVYFAGLTKKNLPRGKWRFLDEKEIRMLKLNRFD